MNKLLAWFSRRQAQRFIESIDGLISNDPLRVDPKTAKQWVDDAIASGYEYLVIADVYNMFDLDDMDEPWPAKDWRQLQQHLTYLVNAKDATIIQVVRLSEYAKVHFGGATTLA